MPVFCTRLVNRKSTLQGLRACSLFLFIFFFTNGGALAQVSSSHIRSTDLFGNRSVFIQNGGQYGQTVMGFEQMGPIRYGYEGMAMPVLFTPKGIIHLHRKIEKISHEEEEKLERKGLPEEEIERRRKVTDKVITMEWLNANPDVEIQALEKQSTGHSYASLKEKVSSYKKIIYKNLYPGIDLVFSFGENAQPGFEYSLLVAPGADLSKIRFVYGGDVKEIKADAQGKLHIRSAVDEVVSSTPVSYYGTEMSKQPAAVKSAYTLNNREIRFSFPEGYDSSRALVIDPFVSGTANLTGLNAGKAKDVDFDYAGNIYVTGGGAFTASHMLAKYNAAGVLQWTFNGTLTIPSWSFGTYYGGWMVEKPTGNIYLGQGFNPATGFQVIRVTANGLYDNYITTANPSFREAWKMFWSCNNGSPQILIAGGGTNSNINFGVFTPPATTVTALNVTGVGYTGANGWAQDIADFVFDPANNDMYSIYGSLLGTPSIGNKIYKNTAPYSAASVAWNVSSGYNTVSEAANRPYLVAGGLVDNSANMLWVNASYLYYWDGKNLKAFDKATGATAGTPLTTGNTPFMQGGIIADACNNVFVGEANGLIKVYNFNGTTFSDAPADINIPGFSGKAVYDLAYDEGKKLLYASGDGFVASFDVSAYCPTTLYAVNIVPNCVTATATATVAPVPPAGSVVTYVLFNGTTQLATNTTGVFTGLNPGITYTIVATINQACSGSQATNSFVMPGPTAAATATNTLCGALTGTITASGTGGAAPYTYSIDGTNFQGSNLFSGLSAGVYTVTVKDVNGCPDTVRVTILNTNGPVFSFTQTNADCGSNNGTVTVAASGGTAPYQYSINNGATYQAGNFFTGLTGGTYTLVVKDANGCTNATVVIITSSTAPQLTVTPATATCGGNNGTITAFGSGGTAPLQYSINGNIYQAGNVFTGLTPGTYVVTVKDANGCMNTASAVIANSPAPVVSAVSTAAQCNNVNGTITATGTGGLAPLSYSIDGVNFQVSNIFTGLAPGTYTVTAKDATGCSGITTVTVPSTNGPAATATSTTSSCAASTGTITITGAGGTVPYTYSINGTTFQVSNLFSALAPGNYVVYVRDAAGCIGTFTIAVPATAGPLITAVVTPTSCAANTGTITANGSGGTAPLQYSIDGITYQASNSFAGLASGLYVVYVKDANGCIKTTTVNITNTSNLVLNVSSLASSCSGSSGVITATATGGVGGLQYSMDGVTYQASNVFTGIAPGTYSVYVKDANNCIVTKTTSVTSVAGPTFTITVVQQGTCGTASGAIRVNASGGVPPLTYSLDGAAFQALPVFINLSPAVHTVQVRDATGCLSAIQSVTITNSGAGAAPTDVTFRVSNILGCTGEGRIKNIRGVPTGGGNNYTFSLDGGAFTTANQFRPVAAGVHTITAMNQNGCTVTRIAIVGSGTPATATSTVTSSACNASTGTITLTGVGVNAPYHTSIDGGTTWQTFNTTFTYTALAPGTYTIQIADDADFTTGPPDIPGACITTIFVVVPSVGGPSINITTVPATCTANNGSITANGSGGTGTYLYSLNGGAYSSVNTFSNLAPGNYAVSVQDGSGCTTGVNVNLPGGAVPAMTLVTEPVSCNSGNGSITINATGGTAPLEYSINGTVFQSSNVFSNLTAGTYTVYVKDVNGCYSSTTATITNTALPRVAAFTIAATCNNNDGSIVASGTQGTTPYVFSIDGTVYQSSGTFSNLAAGFYTIYIKDARGCITTTGVTVSNTGGPALSLGATAAVCGNPNGTITATASGGVAPLQYSLNGGAFQASNSFSGLVPGTYTITVADFNGCLNARQIVVANTNGPQVLTAVLQHAACGGNNGSITATASGGVGALQYSINGVTYQPGTVFTNLAAGTYTLYVKDVNNCVKTISVTLLNLAGPALTTSSSPSSCGLSDGTITANASGGTGVLQYSINGVLFQASNIFTGLAAGSYTITVRDARNCTSTSVVNVGTAGSAVTPLFVQAGPYCSGAVIPALPTLSQNGITGTWAPALNNTTTTTYTFTPSAGQCANTTTMTITIHPKPAPTIYHN